MKQLPKFFGIALAVIGYGIYCDWYIIDIAAWTAIISALAIPAAWLLSTIVSVKMEVSDDERERQLTEVKLIVIACFVTADIIMFIGWLG